MPTPAKNSVDQRVTELAPLVKRLAYQFMARVPSSVQVDDLIQAGLIGLMDAAGNFDDSQGAQFETYAVQRIRGAMLDELRSADWLPRTLRRSLREIEAAIGKLEQKFGRPPLEQEIADHLGMPISEYQRTLGDARGHQLLYYEDFDASEDDDFLDTHCADEHGDPLKQITDVGFRNSLIAAIDKLPEREKLMMALYYEQDLNLKEIGQVMGVSESRVCQLHSQAVVRIRSHLKEWINGK